MIFLVLRLKIGLNIKRVAAHLLNVASSVVNPFDKVGFREDEK
ncbi:MAG: hypothetical protein Q8K98_02765 [Bacteroidota bacterium]|nr:hypothetical protein [Bacteroidota bacterium]